MCRLRGVPVEVMAHRITLRSAEFPIPSVIRPPENPAIGQDRCPVAGRGVDRLRHAGGFQCETVGTAWGLVGSGLAEQPRTRLVSLDRVPSLFKRRCGFRDSVIRGSPALDQVATLRPANREHPRRFDVPTTEPVLRNLPGLRVDFAV